MPSGNGISGIHADIKLGSVQVAEAMKWNFDFKSQIHAYSSNKTGGYARKVSGRLDGTVQMDGAYDPASPIDQQLGVGASVTLKLYTNATQFYSVPAIVESVKLTADIDTGDFEKWTVNCQTDGAWTTAVAG